MPCHMKTPCADPDWLIDWFMLNAQTALFHLYPGDEHKMGDKVNINWWWNEKYDGTQW